MAWLTWKILLYLLTTHLAWWVSMSPAVWKECLVFHNEDHGQHLGFQDCVAFYHKGKHWASKGTPMRSDSHGPHLIVLQSNNRSSTKHVFFSTYAFKKFNNVELKQYVTEYSPSHRRDHREIMNVNNNLLDILCKRAEILLSCWGQSKNLYLM